MQFQNKKKAPAQPLLFMRHGATEANLAGLRCGGDLDVPLTELGRRQVAEVARSLREKRLAVGLIVTSHLARTRASAAIIAAALPGVDVLVEPGFAERSLGAWNLQPIAVTEPDLAHGVTPPGGESREDFEERIAVAVQTLMPHLDRRPLLVGSKGVARVLTALTGLPHRQGLSNAEVARFDLAALDWRSTRRYAA
jgi:probable phosphoglycerate mutase